MWLCQNNSRILRNIFFLNFIVRIMKTKNLLFLEFYLFCLEHSCRIPVNLQYSMEVLSLILVLCAVERFSGNLSNSNVEVRV